MPYIENRIVHDADAHTMELPNWFDQYGNNKIQKAFKDRFQGNKGLAQTYFENIDQVHQGKSYQEKNSEELMVRKNYDALGSFNKEDRSKALDLLGVKSQLVFPTSPNVWLESLEHGISEFLTRVSIADFLTCQAAGQASGQPSSHLSPNSFWL